MIEIESRRTSTRRPVVASATITLETSEMVNCFTINVSNGGVKLRLPHGAEVSGEFRVSVPAARVKNRRARMVWRNGDELGVRYV